MGRALGLRSCGRSSHPAHVPAHFVGCRGRAAAWFGHCGHTAAHLNIKRVREGAGATVGIIDSALVQQYCQRNSSSRAILSSCSAGGFGSEEGQSADLQREADFCRSTRAFFTSCSSMLMPTSPWRSSPCCRRPIVDKSSPRAAFEVRQGPVHRFSPQCAACLACSTPARVSRASHAPLHTTRTATQRPHCLTHPPRPPFCPSAVAAAVCTKHGRRPHAARRPFGRR